jgi:hypothetical protein
VLGFSVLSLAGCTKETATTETAQAKVVEYQGEDGKSVCDILKNKYQVDATTSDFGMMVNSINGLKATDKEFWLYSVNGKSGEIACDKQTTTNTDKVKWEYKGF